MAGEPMSSQETVLQINKSSYPREHREYVRFSVKCRILHACMVISFISLAITGMALKFSYAFWAVLIARALGGFQSAGVIHRAAAVLMFGIFIVHLHDLYLLKKNKYGSWMKLLFGPNSMIPNARDGKQFVATIKWFVGMGPKPAYGRWTYWEKFDYFAVFWGIFIIGSTGLTLWFPVFFTRFVPGVFLNVATIIHSDEALLAVGFIFTIHFFNTHLRPEKFPMDTTVFTGHMKMAELKRDKPLEYEELVRGGRLEQNLAAPHPEVVMKTIRVFAWAALIIGTALIASIVYAMIFVYR